MQSYFVNHCFAQNTKPLNPRNVCSPKPLAVGELDCEESRAITQLGLQAAVMQAIGSNVRLHRISSSLRASYLSRNLTFDLLASLYSDDHASPPHPISIIF